MIEHCAPCDQATAAYRLPAKLSVSSPAVLHVLTCQIAWPCVYLSMHALSLPQLCLQMKNSDIQLVREAGSSVHNHADMQLFKRCCMRLT